MAKNSRLWAKNGFWAEIQGAVSIYFTRNFLLKTKV